VRRRRRPGVTLTRQASENSTDEYRAEVLADVQLPRLATPEDTAAMVAFLLSDDGAYINGQTILVDGGRNFT
jgi:NAD(P)-dependent dehydrogenase (short-subunit alcohol dehydrogenase family)